MFRILRTAILGVLISATLALFFPMPTWADSDGSSGSQSESGDGDRGDSHDRGDNHDGGEDDDGGQTATGANTPTSRPSSSLTTGGIGTSNLLRNNLGRVVNQDEALNAVSAGKAVTLPLLLAYMANKYPGEIVDIKLWAKEDKYTYEVKYLSNIVILSSVVLDAKTLGKL